MSNKIVIVPIGQQYPFNSHLDFRQSTSQVQARKVIPFNSQTRIAIKEKIRMLKSLGFQHLVGLISISEEQDSMTVNFEYIPTKFQVNFQHFSDELVEKIKKQLLELAQTLSSHFIDHEFNFNNVGIDGKNNLKYYLGFDFQINRNLDRDQTTIKYRQQLAAFFGLDSPIKRRKSTYQDCYHETMDTSCKETPLQDKKIPTKPMKKNSFNLPVAGRLQCDSLDRSGKRLTYNFNRPVNCWTANQQEKDQKKKSVESKYVKHNRLQAKIDRLKSAIKSVADKKGAKTIGHFTDRLNTCNNNDNFNQILKDQGAITQKRGAQTKDKWNFKDCYQNQQPLTVAQNNQNIAGRLAQEHANTKKDHTKNKLSLQCYPIEDKQQNQYTLLASKNIYCQQFMQFLQGENLSPIVEKDLKKTNFSTKQNHLKPTLLIDSKESAEEIKSRVRRAINTSIKLMSSLRPKETIHFQ